MRISLVHYSAPPVIGGVERVLAQQAQTLARHGHQAVVVCATKGARVDGAVMEYAPNFYIKRVLSALAGSDVVIVHNMFTMPFNWDSTKTLAQISREMTGARFINWVHDIDVTRGDFEALDLRASHVAVSEVRRREFCKMAGLKEANCAVVPNGVDVLATLGLGKNVAAFAAKHKLLSREMVLFHPARVLSRKNIELDVEVTAALRKQGVDAVCVVTGARDPHRPESDGYADSVRALVAKRKMQDAVLFVADAFEPGEDEVRGFYSLVDAVFFPSKSEGFGLPLLEAALHRLPVFCSDIPSHRELADHDAHLFKLTEDPAGLARKIAAALKKDTSLNRRREVLRRFDWDGIYKEYLEPLLKKS
jgi:glycosyltransferase involved in cell wall biosynthesis